MIKGIVIDNCSWNFAEFCVWIKDNIALLAYIHETMCPLQWLSRKTLAALLNNPQEGKA